MILKIILTVKKSKINKLKKIICSCKNKIDYCKRIDIFNLYTYNIINIFTTS